MILHLAKVDEIGIHSPTFVLGSLICFGIIYALYRHFNRISIAHMPGPEPESFVFGNLPELFQSQAGVPDLKWQSEYGGIARIRGAFGEDRLFVSDPKAMQYIFHTSGYGFLKWPERTEISRVLMGRGLLWADGEIHKRQRKVMLPGFGAPESKSFISIFQKVASDLCGHWSDLLASSTDQTLELNAASWLSRATMDSLGEAAFDYHFGALEQKDNELMKAYFGLMSDTLGQPSRKTILLQTMMPVWGLNLMSRYSRSKHHVHARHTANLASQIAKALIDMKAQSLLQGKEGSKDILSLLVKANASENSASRLTEEEMIAQMRTLLLAGHETSATSLSWVLYELARHSEVQQKLRDEIRAMERSRGGVKLTAADFDNMPYMAAVLKESLRVHPAVYQNYRLAARDDVLPLSKPITTLTGEVISELPVGKGTKIVLSIAAYNRNKDVFGTDADIFDPDRWLRDSGERKGPALGVYGNLLTFAGGVRTCIGWRFALYEMQTLLVEIINNFELAPGESFSRLRREACLVMVPTLEGEEAKGENLPLKVSIAPRE
ncbi:cytochrome p450 [Moniliophthora roreri MCA 2997]|uniref:Cytochrome p450 n=1 Tax=Moniliophthora roreri (strain MCA 2997) TaxID=1381753 RepID=V2WVX3_MONRO|nr:cytochrome p450 [Moniliophthora roreri MCA 2997]